MKIFHKVTVDAIKKFYSPNSDDGILIETIVKFDLRSINCKTYQFDQEFSARRLCNWQIPKLYREYPHVRTGRTQIIANDKGHLLPGVPKPPKSNAWGHFTPTWRLPNKITLKTAEELRYPKTLLHQVKPKSQKRNQEKEKKGKEQKEKEETPEEKEKKEKVEEREKLTCPDKVPCPQQDNENEEYSLNELCEDDKIDEVKDLTYTPGDLTDPEQRHPSYYTLRPKEEVSLQQLQQSEMKAKPRYHSAESLRERSPKVLSPFACVYRNFEMAKKCAKENLEHHPLPDTVTDAMFRKLQMQGALNPGLALKEEPHTTGIGWKGYGATGPTQCTKLRIYRPKTSAGKRPKNGDGRPGSTGSFDRKWRFITQPSVKPIDLAICWDMRPENPQDEPKRTTHIDGSNGSAAPAVFTMVYSPKQPEDDVDEETRKSSASKQSCDGIHGCGSVKSSSAGSHRSHKTLYIPAPNPDLKRPKTTAHSPSIHNETMKNNVDPNNNARSRSISTNSLYVNPPLTRKFSKETNQTFDSLLSVNKTNLNDRKKLHQSSPDLSTIGSKNNCHSDCLLKKNHCRPCAACLAKCEAEPQRPKSEYKMAFKAGKANGNNSVNSGNSNASGSKASVKVPKQRDPYAKRNYDITSLHPPFSLWKGTSCQSYPEHWRLASIYQHSYKPLEFRKRPLLASVYQ